MTRKNPNARPVVNVRAQASSIKLDIDVTDPLTIWRSARGLAADIVYPLSPAILALIPIVDEQMALGKGEGKWTTMGTDKFFRCRFHPDAITRWVDEALAVSAENPCENCGAVSHNPLDYIAGVIVHEAMHPLNKHNDRACTLKAQPQVFNIAGDLEINTMLLETFKLAQEEQATNNRSYASGTKLCLPKGVVVASSYKLYDGTVGVEEHRTAEYYYDLIMSDIVEAYKQGKIKEQSNDGSDDSDGSGGIVIPKDMIDPGCGSCSHGDSKHDKDAEPSETVEGVSQAEQNEIAREVAAKVRESHSRGHMPAGMQRWADGILTPPKYNWRKEFGRTLRGFLGHSHGYELQTFRKFHRDCAASNYSVISPSMYQPKPHVGIVLDTSGSMGDFSPGSPLYDAVCEVEGICKSLDVEIEVLDVDCRPDSSDIQRVKSARNIRVAGGGGTDMGAGIMVFDTRKGKKPDIVVVLTDGMTPWPASKPRHFQTIIGLIGDYTDSGIPSWVKKTVRIV